MKLHDPQRPTINHRPAFLPGNVVIPHLMIWPLPNGLVELSMMLPLKGDHRFTGKYFRLEIKPETLPSAIDLFTSDPEQFVSDCFMADPNGFVPNIALEPSDKQLARDLKNGREETLNVATSIADALDMI